MKCTDETVNPDSQISSKSLHFNPPNPPPNRLPYPTRQLLLIPPNSVHIRPNQHMNLWQMILGIAIMALAFALWTTSEATRATLIVMVVGSGIVALCLHSILRLFDLLGRFGDNPSRHNGIHLLTHSTITLFACAIGVGALTWVGFFLLWPR